MGKIGERNYCTAAYAIDQQHAGKAHTLYSLLLDRWCYGNHLRQPVLLLELGL